MLLYPLHGIHIVWESPHRNMAEKMSIVTSVLGVGLTVD